MRRKQLIWGLVVPVVILLCSFLGYSGNQSATRYFLVPTIDLPGASINRYPIDVDNGQTDTLFQVVSKEGTPVSYFRKIIQSVCFDEKCRLLTVNLYWNITGRYLGFELPAGEFLSKTDHVPFGPAEYAQLNKLLADSLSPLSGFSLNDIVPKADTTSKGVDGVTSATSSNVSAYVLKGAGYTTYTMWHLIYGKTRHQVMQLTEKILSPELILKILRSKDMGDRYWALDRITERIPIGAELQEGIISIIDDSNYNLSIEALGAFKPEHLKSEALQKALLYKFYSNSYSLRNVLVNKLAEAPSISAVIKLDLARQLKSLNGELFVNVLGLFEKQKVNDRETIRIIAELLGSKNRFVSKKVYDFLIQARSDDPVIKQKLEDYKY